MCMDELGQVTSHSGLKTDENERNFKAQIIIQHHGAVQPLTAISWLARALLRPQTAHTARHRKQLEKADPFTLAVCGRDI